MMSFDELPAVDTPWSSVGYLTYKRTYSRKLDETLDNDSPTEEFEDTVLRAINACDKQLHCGFTKDEEFRLAEYMLSLKASVAGRFLWQLGTDTVDRFGLASLQNCAFTTVDHPIRPFTWCMDMLALGSGVGYNIQKENVDKLPKVKEWFSAPSRLDDGGADFIVPDSREGWVRLLGKTLKAAFLSHSPEKGSFTFSTQVIRGKGSPIRGFGGVACLTGDTVVYKDRKKAQDQNESTIEELYQMERGLGFWEGKPNHFDKVKIRSLDESTGGFYRNNVVSVIDNGIADVYEITTSLGYTIKATMNHRFMDDSGNYQFLNNFAEGDLIAVNGTALQPRKACVDCGEEISPRAERCNHCKYVRQRESANQHFDENPLNNNENNLIVICDSCHKDIHKTTKYVGNPYSHRYVTYDEILSITYVGKEQVYDLQMEAPNHNFVANGFVSHNSGPEDLCWGVDKIAEVLMKRRGKKIRPIDALDMMNIVGHIIVAGNVRRSAQIAIGDPDDVEYLLAKRWDMGHIPKWRSMSNNSVVCSDIDELHDYFWDGYEGRGEPYGLINLELARSCGRLGETQYPDPTVNGFNPCAEQSLANYETCCLSEIFLPNIESYEQLLDVLELFYRVNKHSLLLPSHHPETQKIVHENMRMGIGVTGVLQSKKHQRGWLKNAYKHLRQFDKEYSKRNRMPESVKLTTVKPSGTLSLLSGVTPGIHPGYAQYMYRRITISSDNPLVEVCKVHGYPMEYKKELDGTEDYGSMVVTFPFSYPKGTKLAKHMTALDQLREVHTMQKEWSDNSVSCTVYYRKEEIPEIRKYLRTNYKDGYKSLSFLLHSEHGFEQAPYEEITKKDFDKLSEDTTVISSLDLASFDSDDECVGGTCPIK